MQYCRAKKFYTEVLIFPVKNISNYSFQKRSKIYMQCGTTDTKNKNRNFAGYSTCNGKSKITRQGFWDRIEETE